MEPWNWETFERISVKRLNLDQRLILLAMISRGMNEDFTFDDLGKILFD